MFALQELLDPVKMSGCSLIVWPQEQVWDANIDIA